MVPKACPRPLENWQPVKLLVAICRLIDPLTSDIVNPARTWNVWVGGWVILWANLLRLNNTVLLYTAERTHISSQHLRSGELLFVMNQCFMRVTEINNNEKSLHRTVVFSVFRLRLNIKNGTIYGKIWYIPVGINISLYRFAHSGSSHIRTNHAVTRPTVTISILHITRLFRC